MTPFKTQAHIHSLNGKMDEITVLEKVGENDYIVDYKGVKCHALVVHDIVVLAHLFNYGDLVHFSIERVDMGLCFERCHY